MFVTQTLPFGTLLRQLRKRAGMTQRDLAAALGYSDSLISGLEKGQRQPDLAMVHTHFIPALGLQDDPRSAAHLLECAAITRGERPPTMRHLPSAPKPRYADRPRAVHRLPALPIELIGRSETVPQLSNRLLGHGGRLLTLVGPPGVGKTTLAVAVATQVQQHYPDGARFIPLAAINDATLMAATLVATVAPGDNSNKPPQTRALELLRPQATLLVLDNLEQIAGAASLIATLLAECPALTILATSRERLHLRAEQRCKVPPLDLNAAVDLFVQRAQAVADDFLLTAENHATIAAICTRLDCLPLALELCAAQIELFAPAQLLAQLQARPLDLLVDGAHDLPPQQRTLRLAIQRSYHLLNEAERSLLRSLSIFAGGFALPQVEQVSLYQPEGQIRPLSAVLRALLHKSLLRSETTSAGEQRFFLLETIREYALEQARTCGEEPQLRQHHYTTYLNLFRTADSHLRGPEAITWLACLDPEQDNIRAALRWALDQRRYTDVAWLMMAVSDFWYLRGHWYEKASWLGQLLPHRHMLDANLRLATLIEFGLKEFMPLDHLVSEVMQLLESCSEKLLQANTWQFIAVCTGVYNADDVQAGVAWERSIALARAAGEVSGLGAEFGCLADRDFVLATSLHAYAGFLIDHGDLSRAMSFAMESLHLYQARGNRIGVIDSLGNLGLLALLQGDLAQAHTHFHEAVTIAAAFKVYDMLGLWQPFLGIVTLYGGDAVEARRLLHDSLSRGLELKNKFYLARVCTYLAEVALAEGELDQAEQWLGKSLIHYTDPRRVTIDQIERLWVNARLATMQQRYHCAAILFGLAEEIHHQIHHIYQGPMLPLVNAALTTVQAALEPAAFAEAFAAGQQMPLAEAFVTILMPNSPDTVAKLGNKKGSNCIVEA